MEVLKADGRKRGRRQAAHCHRSDPSIITIFADGDLYSNCDYLSRIKTGSKNKRNNSRANHKYHFVSPALRSASKHFLIW